MRYPKHEINWSEVSVQHSMTLLALQLLFRKVSESMGDHDSGIVDAGSVD